MIIIVIQAILLLFLVYRLRTDLSLGNGFAAALTLVLIMLICSIFLNPNILFLLLSFLPFIPVFNEFLFKVPILSKILTELGIFLKVLIRTGIPNKKIEKAIYKVHGIKISKPDK